MKIQNLKSIVVPSRVKVNKKKNLLELIYQGNVPRKERRNLQPSLEKEEKHSHQMRKFHVGNH